MNYKFNCPKYKCHSISIEEIQINIVCTSEVTGMDKDFLEYDGRFVNDGGDISHYQCRECGYVLKNDIGEEITTCEDLINHSLITIIK